MHSDDGSPTFETVDWDEHSRSRTIVTSERLLATIGLLIVATLALYNRYYVHVYVFGNWNASALDWLLLSGFVLLVSFVVIPALRQGQVVRMVAQQIRSRPLLVAATLYLALFVLLGSIGPTIYRDPGLQFQIEYLPPVGFSAEFTGVECPGGTTGDAFNRVCHGSMDYPLGTNHRGHPIGFLLVEGAQTALYVVIFTLAFVVPAAVATGVGAALYGGLVDDILMSLVTIQLSIPAVIVYFVGFVVFRPSMLLLLVVFGLFSWGSVARLVRSETIQRLNAGHVRVARGLGAPQSYLARRHLLPNITNTVVPAVFHLCAILVLVEAGIAFMGFHNIELYSWGATISESINAQIGSRLQTRANRPAYRIWWVSALPALALTMTLLSFKLLGDGLRDALDPRTES